MRMQNMNCNLECNHNIAKKWWVFKKEFVLKKMLKYSNKFFNPFK